MIATGVALALRLFLPDEWWSAAIAVGLVVGLLVWLRLTHPPAGADPLLVFATEPSLSFLVAPVLVGAALLVAVATVFHRLGGTTYPLRPPTRHSPGTLPPT